MQLTTDGHTFKFATFRSQDSACFDVIVTTIATYSFLRIQLHFLSMEELILIELFKVES